MAERATFRQENNVSGILDARRSARRAGKRTLSAVSDASCDDEGGRRFAFPPYALGLLSLDVIPAKAGIHVSTSEVAAEWIPAFAGMTPEETEHRRKEALVLASHSAFPPSGQFIL
ncbi:MAG: hypothetical protein JO255_16525 [Alphaproteobacteria bacterium]|nr:hypothetical protein [Alphaproteobacteria bacterium]